MLTKLLPVACAALVLAACATPSRQTQPVAKAGKPPAGCVAQIATHIPVTNTQCAGFGATYTNKDLQNTGQPYANQALRLLDPSVQLTGH
ncbi:MAG: hypothetical protein WBE65_10950 [Steroidobacteraceae bacterium]